MNIIYELDEEINASGHTPHDIKWLALNYGSYKTPYIRLKPTEGLEGYNQAVELYSLIDYNDGFGSQELGGIIVFNDGSWLDRREYDGSEWWEFQQTPKIEDYNNN